MIHFIIKTKIMPLLFWFYDGNILYDMEISRWLIYYMIWRYRDSEATHETE